MVLDSKSQNIINSILQFMKREADAGAPMIPLSKVQQRVSAATGISLRTINRIAKESREIEKGEKPSFSTPNKIRKNRKSKIPFLMGSNDSRSMYQQLAASMRGQPRGRSRFGGRPFRKGGLSRQARNQQKIEEYKQKKNSETVDILSKKLSSKLMPGVKTGDSGMDRLEAVNTLRCITLYVTTRDKYPTLQPAMKLVLHSEDLPVPKYPEVIALILILLTLKNKHAAT
ncbi:hypothetical protein ILUMI_12660 [Ignelater luminosus]|uniref:Uncharacterized protein n=1 Tax=Ignelater luminosus TaxID=2038154 RepID=A0A8K0CTV3_IGNLU|nr:hypothetical protein ILUMI_12660 [Ignelater luminosus]